jgi:flagellar motility protein MotE (MotC chaperone)
MSPEGAAAMFGEMQDDDVVRILYTMKNEQASLILDTISKMGKTEAKRAAALTERLQQVLPVSTNSIASTAP